MGDHERKHKESQASAPDRHVPEPDTKLGNVGRLGAGMGLSRTATGSADVLGGSTVDPATTDRLKARAGTGSSLPSEVADDMGRHLDTDLSQVRVHTDKEANTIARSLQAKAFTLGRDIYFSSGAFSPQSGSGKRLLAHELSHVAQHATAPNSRTGSSRPVVGRADDSAEREADKMADAVLAGRPARSAAAASPGVKRVALADGQQIRRVIGMTVIATTKEGKFEDGDQDIPKAFLDLSGAMAKTITSGSTGQSYNDSSTDNALTGTGAIQAFAGVEMAGGLKKGLTSGKEIFDAGKHLKHGYTKHDFGLEDENGAALEARHDSLSKNAGAMGMEKGVTGMLQGGGGVGAGIESAVKAGTTNVPIVGDVMNFATAGIQAKASVEDSVASARLGLQRRGIKHTSDLHLPLDLRVKRFAAFIKTVAFGGSSLKRSDLKRYEDVVKQYRAKHPRPKARRKRKGKPAPPPVWDETNILGWKTWQAGDPSFDADGNADQRKQWLEFLKSEGIKDFGTGTEVRKEYKKNELQNLTQPGGRELTEDESSYVQLRNLTKMSKFGQRRKAETASLNAVEATGNALDAAGTFTAAGDLGATKLSGKILKTGATAYKGVKTLVKRARRVHKLRTARNTAEYGTTKERGAWWGAKQFFAGNLDQRMEKTRDSLGGAPGPGVKASKDFSSDPVQLHKLLRKLTLQCDRRIDDFIGCLFSENKQVRDKAKKILHIIAESNLAGAISKIDDKDLDLLYKVKQKMTPAPTPGGPPSAQAQQDAEAYATQHQVEYDRRVEVIKSTIRSQLAGVGG